MTTKRKSGLADSHFFTQSRDVEILESNTTPQKTGVQNKQLEAKTERVERSVRDARRERGVRATKASGTNGANGDSDNTPRAERTVKQSAKTTRKRCSFELFIWQEESIQQLALQRTAKLKRPVYKSEIVREALERLFKQEGLS